MWERTLQDLIRGLRANKKEESQFISQAIDEIREEVKKKDMDLKAAAVLKLVYLEMLGYDMKWAAFYVVEVMSSSKFHIKSIGYLGASQSFQQDTDVLMLTTNLLKKDLSSNPNDVAVALDGLSNIVTPDLARDVSSDMFTMLNHSKAYIRKRAVLTLFKIFLKYPETLDRNYGRLQEKLEDPDPGVVSATVNVICELARIDPQPYLPLAPILFHLLTTSSNNWMLIKLIKLFGSLAPLEPRLVKKLYNPITDLISTTPAISLLYECVRTCITGGMLDGPSGQSLADTCVRKLVTFLQDQDQNLKYIALLSLVKVVPYYPNLAAEYQEVILSGMDDTDISIRMRTLELLSAMVDEGNIQSIVQQLLNHLLKSQSTAPQIESAAHSLVKTASGATAPISPPSDLTPSYRLAVANHIIDICRQVGHVNSEWLVSVYIDLAYVARAEVGIPIKESILEIVLSCPSARRYSVKQMAKLIDDDVFILNASEPGSCPEVLGAAAWICGEYASFLADPRQTLRRLFQPALQRLSPDIIASYLHAGLKLFSHWASSLAQEWTSSMLDVLKSTVSSLLADVDPYTLHADVEVRERALNTVQLLTFVMMDAKNFRLSMQSGEDVDSMKEFQPNYPKSLYLVEPLFSSYALQAVSNRNEGTSTEPSIVDLDKWIVASIEPRSDEYVRVDEHLDTVTKSKVKKSKVKSKGKRREVDPIPHASEEKSSATSEAHKARRKEIESNPYYLKSAPAKTDDVDSIPILRLEESMPIGEDENSFEHQYIMQGSGELSQPLNGNPWKQSIEPFPGQVDKNEGRDNLTQVLEPLKVTKVKKKKKSGGGKPS